MADTIAFISNLVTIATGVCGTALFIYRHSRSSQSTTTQNPTSPSSSRPGLNMTTVGLIISIIIIITGLFTAGLLLQPQIVAKQHQDFYDQQMTKPSTYSSSLKDVDHQWEIGQPHGNGGHCLFQGQAYDITMTLEDHYYPCYMVKPLDNFMMQVQMQIKHGDAGAIIFRDDSHRSDYYDLFLSTTGTYTLNYWANETGSDVVVLTQGFNSKFYDDQVQGRLSIVTIVANGADFSIYIDGKYIGSAQDTRISSGRIALVAQKLLNDTEVIYKSVRI